MDVGKGCNCIKSPPNKTPCCKKIYICRRCHNEDEDHKVDMSLVKKLICIKCNTRQNVSNECIYCKQKFGEYGCLICKLFDIDKKQYHCTECGLCRIGPQEVFFHCPTCKICLNVILRNNHKCVEPDSQEPAPPSKILIS